MEKRCNGCGESKPNSDYHKNVRAKDGLQSRCKPCHVRAVAESVNRSSEAREAYLEGQSRRQKENRSINNIAGARYRSKRLEGDPDVFRAENAAKAARWRAAHPDKAKAHKAKWNAANPGKVNEHSNRRRAQKIGPVNYREIIERDKGACYLCGLPIDITLLRADPMSKHFDHVIPLSKGGPHSMENIRLTHARCNYRKRDRILSITNA